jgi:hypothetical protein
MRVYHGSDVRINEIDLSKSKNLKDFGRGFYVTKRFKDAQFRAASIAIANNTQPIITAFEYHEEYPIAMGIKMKKFETISEEWIEFIVMNRDTRIAHPAHSFDIVEGAMADDWFMETHIDIKMQIDRYIKGKISTKTLIEKIKSKELINQICFCTTESLFALELVENKFAIVPSET